MIDLRQSSGVVVVGSPNHDSNTECKKCSAESVKENECDKCHEIVVETTSSNSKRVRTPIRLGDNSISGGINAARGGGGSVSY